MILVFGKTGQVATELQKFSDVLALGREKVDLSNPVECGNCIKAYSPSMVVNAAAYTAVDLAEKENVLAKIINSDAPIAMAEACYDINIPFVHISTDYVFNGNGENPWKISDNPDPQNVYGYSKLMGEIGIRKSGAIHAILRTSWVFSAHGSNFVKSMLSLSEKCNVLNIVSDQIGGPTPARDIAKACIEIADQLKKDPKKTGTYHFSGTPNVSWVNFASEIFFKTGRKVFVIPILSKDYQRLAKRPLNSRLDCSYTYKVFGIRQPDWNVGLKQILQDIEVI